MLVPAGIYSHVIPSVVYSLTPLHDLDSVSLFRRKQYHRRLKPRQGLKKSTLNEQRLKLLMSLDFEWNAQEAAWSRHLANLLKFKAEHGHVHVPLNYREDPKLGLWVSLRK